MTTPLRRFLRPSARSAPGERCEMCGDLVEKRHSHVIDLHSRAILCTCRGCYLLFTRPGAGSGRHRAVPERYRHVRVFPPGERLWESVGIPVATAFFFTNSGLGRTTAFYPSPAGATESLLPLDAWEEVLGAGTDLGTPEPDVEAMLLNRVEGRFEAFLVPIDVCYELVGLVKLHWRGFDGGTEAGQAIDGFFASLRDRSTSVEPADG
jgi:Family of unknown function (DUF5947)